MATRKKDAPPALAAGADPAEQAPPSPNDFPSPAREDRIREAAYAAAERRGFAPGGEVGDWLQAEAEVDGKEGAAP